MRYKNYILILVFLLTSFSLKAQQKDINIKIHVKGVYETNISLLPLAGDNALRPLIEKKYIKNGENCIINIPKDRLPGQFVLRFDYKQKAESAPYPSEKYFFVNNQELELWVHPMHVNNPDSTYFQNGEKENSLFDSFMRENSLKKKKLNLLRNFLIEYDRPDSKFYRIGMEEYEKRREEFNNWLVKMSDENKEQFVSHLFRFQYVTPILWEGTEADRVQSMIKHYFDGIDLSDPVIIKTMDMGQWMDSYVNIYGAMATTVQLRDSLFSTAGRRAIEKAKQGHPLVDGWMVDYFYRGFESFNMQSGIQMLETYINDPHCLTKKRLAIQKRLDGMKTMMVGRIAPDFTIKQDNGEETQFLNYKTEKEFKLVLFWSADCIHCKEEVEKLSQWHKKSENKEMVEVIALSLDETKAEIEKWEEKRKRLSGWKHIRVDRGINSPEAEAYYILSVPVMVLVNSQTNEIVAFPGNVDQLQKAIMDYFN